MRSVDGGVDANVEAQRNRERRTVPAAYAGSRAAAGELEEVGVGFEAAASRARPAPSPLPLSSSGAECARAAPDRRRRSSGILPDSARSSACRTPSGSARPIAKPFEPDAAAELHVAAAEAAGDAFEPDALGVEGDRAVDRLERVRQREVAEPAVDDRRRAAEHRRVERSGDLRRAAWRVPRLRMSRKNPCRMPRLASPSASMRDPVLVAGRRVRRPAAACPRRRAAADRSRRRADPARARSAPRS